MTAADLPLRICGENVETGEWIEVRGREKLAPTDETGRVPYAAYGTRSDMPLPIAKMSDVEASVSYWRGDILSFDTTTKEETYNCTEYETRSTVYGGKLSLVPFANR